MLQPVGPEALGWFPKPIKDMADFRKYKFRTPPGIPGQTYKAMTAHEKKSLEVAANASLAKSLSYRIYENGKALQELTTKHGVILEDTPSDYFKEYMAAAKATLNKNAEQNKFFKKVYDSMKEFADVAVPFWSGAQMSNAKLGMAHAATLK